MDLFLDLPKFPLGALSILSYFVDIRILPVIVHTYIEEYITIKYLLYILVFFTCVRGSAPVVESGKLEYLLRYLPKCILKYNSPNRKC